MYIYQHLKSLSNLIIALKVYIRKVQKKKTNVIECDEKLVKNMNIRMIIHNLKILMLQFSIIRLFQLNSNITSFLICCTFNVGYLFV